MHFRIDARFPDLGNASTPFENPELLDRSFNLELPSHFESLLTVYKYISTPCLCCLFIQNLMYTNCHCFNVMPFVIVCFLWINYCSPRLAKFTLNNTYFHIFHFFIFSIFFTYFRNTFFFIQNILNRLFSFAWCHHSGLKYIRCLWEPPLIFIEIWSHKIGMRESKVFVCHHPNFTVRSTAHNAVVISTSEDMLESYLRARNNTTCKELWTRMVLGNC